MTAYIPATDFAPEPRRTRPMRIASIVTSLTSGGAEILVTNLNTRYSASGAQAGVVAFCDAPVLGNSREMEAQLRDDLEQAGCRFETLGLPARRGFFHGALALHRYLRRERPDVVHAHTVRAVVMLAMCNYRGPLVFTHHNSKLSFSPRMFRMLDYAVDHYVAISNDTAAIYRALSRRPFELIRNAPSPKFRAAQPRTGLHTPGQARILSVGAISAQKNYGLLIEAAQLLKAKPPAGSPPPLFRIAGGGEGLAELRAQVSRAGLDDMVQFLGERSDIAALLADTDIYLNTSRYEGFSIAILEALSSAMPVVATDVPGNRGLVKPTTNGLLCPLDRPQSIASAIARLSLEPALYRQLSAGALTSSREFTIEGAATRHLELYASLLRRRATQKD